MKKPPNAKYSQKGNTNKIKKINAKYSHNACGPIKRLKKQKDIKAQSSKKQPIQIKKILRTKLIY